MITSEWRGRLFLSKVLSWRPAPTPGSSRAGRRSCWAGAGGCPAGAAGGERGLEEEAGVLDPGTDWHRRSCRTCSGPGRGRWLTVQVEEACAGKVAGGVLDPGTDWHRRSCRTCSGPGRGRWLTVQVEEACAGKVAGGVLDPGTDWHRRSWQRAWWRGGARAGRWQQPRAAAAASLAAGGWDPAGHHRITAGARAPAGQNLQRDSRAAI